MDILVINNNRGKRGKKTQKARKNTLRVQIKHLEFVIRKQNEQLLEMAAMIDELTVSANEDDRRIEVQSNEVRGLQIALEEMSLLSFPPRKESYGGKNLWILRKHERNLIMVTRPYTKIIINESAMIGIVSKNIHKCATECSIPGHDCTSGFYKALMVSVENRANVLQRFLEMILRQKRLEPCHRLCSQILSEVNG